jgi:hypothetical protein
MSIYVSCSFFSNLWNHLGAIYTYTQRQFCGHLFLRRQETEQSENLIEASKNQQK